ncbi:MAG: hypothetical protein DMG22_10870 [Acidobacteria bacterium]|nr:MAG: hypothetical protein DMG22_10870 [Acidobacteriota bacterium]
MLPSSCVGALGPAGRARRRKHPLESGKSIPGGPKLQAEAIRFTHNTAREAGQAEVCRGEARAAPAGSRLYSA